MSKSNLFKTYDLVAAYKKLKAFSYYDSGDLYLRDRISDFEYDVKTKEDIYAKLHSIALDIENYCNEGIVPSWLDEISFQVLPKKLELKNKATNISTFIKSLERTEDFELQKTVVQIKAGVEVHLVSMLWSIEIGPRLDQQLGDFVFSNRLQKDEDDDILKYGIRLFRPYYQDYASWRDGSIKMAKNVHQNKSSATIISLDIKDYYYNIDFDLDVFHSELNVEEQSKKYINKMLSAIHNAFYLKVGASKKMLPIGLTSSGVIGNFALHEIDLDIKSNVRPIYYGRYVDDIIMVVQDLTIKDHQFSEVMGALFQNTEKIKIVSDVKENKSECGCVVKRQSIHFKTSYGSHYAQMEKLKIFDFHKDAPISLLDEFEKEIRKFSSEVRLLAEDSDVLERFSSESKKISYSDSVLKLRSIDKFDLNKVGFSRFLSSLIQSSKVSSRIDNDEFEKMHYQILSIANGADAILLFRVWEKLVGIYVSHNKFSELKDFLVSVMNCIHQLPIEPNTKEYTPPAINLGVIDVYRDIKTSWYAMLVRGLILSLSGDGGIRALNNLRDELKSNRPTLDPSMPKVHIDILDGLLINAEDRIRKLRKSAMFRHNTCPVPIVAFCKDNEDLDFSGLRNNLGNIQGSSFNWSPSEIKCVLSPRFIHYNEIAELYIIWCVLDKDDLNICFASLVECTNEYYKRINFIEHKQHELNLTLPKIVGRKLNFEAKKEPIFSIEQLGKPRREGTQEIGWEEEEPSKIILGSNSKDSLCIGVANVKVPLIYTEQRFAHQPDLSHSRLIGLNKILNEAAKAKVDILVFPEGFIPFEWLDYVATFCKSNQMAVVGGLEHLCIRSKVFNFLLAALPFKTNGYNNVLLGVIPKSDLNKEELKLIHSLGLDPGASRYTKLIFEWNGHKISLLNCLELSDIKKRAWMRGHIDCLIAIENNKDTNYFSSVVESTARDLHCYVVQVNNSSFGDSRITAPLPTESRDLLRVKGGENQTVLVQNVPINELRRYQYFRESYQTLGGEAEYKDPAPGFPPLDKKRMPQYKKKRK